jgi:hypothetical protein
MNIRIALPAGILGAALTLVPAGVWAGTLATSSFQGDTFICRAVNVGPHAVKTLAVDIINSGSGGLEATSSCSNLTQNHECVKVFSPASAVVAFCRITTSGSAKPVRGSLVALLDIHLQVSEAR